jgi:two-component system sensor histidine kinase DesK
VTRRGLGGDLRPAFDRAAFGEHARTRLFGRGGGVLWLVFVVIPLINAIGRRGPALERGLVIAGASVFVVTYMALVVKVRRQRNPLIARLLFVLLVAIATAMTVCDRPGWGFLFVYCSACAAWIFPPPLGVVGVALCSALAGATSALAGGGSGTAIGVTASAGGVGLMMLVLRDLRVRNDELSEARAELARLAVARERERFARDLHDLLGHTLSVIALKTELAGRLLPDRPGDAQREIADVEEVARTALTEVRDAVSGYRQPTLDGELAGARLALSTAGMNVEVDRPDVALDPDVEAVLSWAVREGATNVIRHSRATRCSLRVRARLSEASVEIVDDGIGAASASGDAGTPSSGVGDEGLDGRAERARFRSVSSGARGHGLEGLAERARPLGGRVEAGPLDGGGFRLAVSVPVTATPPRSATGQASAISPPSASGTASAISPPSASGPASASNLASATRPASATGLAPATGPARAAGLASAIGPASATGPASETVPASTTSPPSAAGPASTAGPASATGPASTTSPPSATDPESATGSASANGPGSATRPASSPAPATRHAPEPEKARASTNAPVTP